MLVLSRRCGEVVVIGETIRVTVLSVQGNKVRIGIDAPPSISVNRQEVHARRIETEIDIPEIREGMDHFGAAEPARTRL